MKKKKSKSFALFWNEAILPAIDQCTREVSDDFSEYLDISDAQLEAKRLSIYSMYLKVREDYKKHYHIKREAASLDVTKLGAIICFSLVKNKIFNINFKQALQEDDIPQRYLIDNWLIDYKIALYACLNITYIGLVVEESGKLDSTKIVDNETFTRIKNHKSLALYKYHNRHERDSFVDGMVKNLAFLDINRLDFDFTAHSIIMDGLREYSRLYFTTYKDADNK